MPFDEEKHLNLSEVLQFPGFLMIVKHCEDLSADTLLPILHSKFGSGETEP